MKKKLAFINIPDATQDECQKLADLLGASVKSEEYTFVYVCGKSWGAISKNDVIELCSALMKETES